MVQTEDGAAELRALIRDARRRSGLGREQVAERAMRQPEAPDIDTEYIRWLERKLVQLRPKDKRFRAVVAVLGIPQAALVRALGL